MGVFQKSILACLFSFLATMAAQRSSGFLSLIFVLGAIAVIFHSKGQTESFVGNASPPARATVSKIARLAEKGEGGAIALKILTPDGSGVETLVGEVSLPGVEGRLGVLKGHAPMLAPLDTGVLRFRKGDQWEPAVVVGGFANVADDKISVLCSEFEQADSLGSVEELKTKLEAATEALSKADSAKDKLDATSEVKKASARLQAATMSA